MSTPTTMSCPKCRGEMTSYERHGVTIDQCADCRGIFLDRGELERLIDAEAAYNTQRRPDDAERYRQPDYRDHDDDDDDHYRGRDKHHRRRGGLLGELFD